MSRRAITYISAYYENHGMLREQQRVWAAYPDHLKALFHAVVTDDVSPEPLAAAHVAEPTGIASFTLNRTLKKVPWNWLFARNLGASQAPTEWILLTDIDHVLPVDTLERLTTIKLHSENVYRLSRGDAPDRTPYKPHPNTWLLTRARFDLIGGYDERLSGHYGSDADFRERVQKYSRAVVMLPEAMVRYPRTVIPDASTTTFQRKLPSDGVALSRIKRERNLDPLWKPLRLTFPWEPVVSWTVEPVGAQC